MLMAFARSYGVLGNTDAVRERTKAAIDLDSGSPGEGSSRSGIYNSLCRMLSCFLVGHWKCRASLLRLCSNYEASLAIAQSFAAADPKDLNWQAVLSISNERIGDVLMRQGRLAEAIKYYEADFDLAQRVMSVRLPAVLDKLGGTYLALGNRNGAFQAYQRMLVVSERLSAEISDPLWKGYLCSSHQNLGRLLMGQGRFDDALAHFIASLSIAEQIVSKDPSDATWQHTLGAAHGYIGSVHLTQGSVQKAVESNKKKLAILERLTASDPKNVFWQNDLATTHVSIGESYLVEGRIDDAHASFRAGHVILEGLAAIDPSDVKWRLNFLGSHLLLALFGDDQVRRFEFVVSTLRIIKEGNRLTLEEERWVPFAEEGLAAVAAGNLQWHWDLLQVFWRAAPITENPIRWRAALMARLRKLDDEGKLTIEQAQWLALAEEYVTKLRQPKQ